MNFPVIFWLWLSLASNILAQTCRADNLTVDLGYGVYQGSVFPGGKLYTWFGIRFAAPPTGTRRWDAPASPTTDRTSPTPNSGNFGCPVAGAAPYSYNQDMCPRDLRNLSSVGNCTTFQSEDCLKLNVVSPVNATNLPVLVFIHGGGYAGGDSTVFVAPIMEQNNYSFVVVTIEYRLNAFGFLASQEFYNDGGVLNVGLRDQLFALQWVQQNICKFGGDARKVTISGQSAGGGSVMQQVLAKNGADGNANFRYAIADSPYLPKQYDYTDNMPKKFYDDFVNQTGCSGAASPLNCLRGKNTEILQLAARRVSGSGVNGTWAFVPVIDPDFAKQRPSAQLYNTNIPINGDAILVDSNANEGYGFVPHNINTAAAFQNYVGQIYPDVPYDDLAAIYQAGASGDQPHGKKFATNGNTGPTALNQSIAAVGQQQRAANMYAESTFICPAYWLADGFSLRNKPVYKMEFSSPPAYHGADFFALFSALNDPSDFQTTKTPNLTADFRNAIMQMWGNFVVTGNPSIPNNVANGDPNDNSPNPASQWKRWTQNAGRYMMVLNQTGDLTIRTGPSNAFRQVLARPWEGDRGGRCDFWKNNGALVPE